jgi:hypothetical protein
LRLRPIVLVEQLRWSWPKAKRSAQRGHVGWSIFAGALLLLIAIARWGDLFRAQTFWEAFLWIAEAALGLVFLIGIFGLLGATLAALFNGFTRSEVWLRRSS